MSYSANLLGFLAVLFLVAALLALRQLRQIWNRVSSLERLCMLQRETSDPVQYRPLPLVALVTASRIEWRGHRFEVGFYRCEDSDAESVADFVSTAVLVGDCPVIYWGEFPDRVAQELLRRGLKKNQDPRGRIAMPATAAEVENLLLRQEWPQVWLVSEGEEQAARLESWQRRFGCGALAFCKQK